MDDEESPKRDTESAESMKARIEKIQQMSSENIAKRFNQIAIDETQAEEKRKANRFNLLRFFRKKNKH